MTRFWGLGYRHLGYLILPTTSVLEWKLEIRDLGSNLGVAFEELCASGQIPASLGQGFLIVPLSKHWERGPR